MIALPILLAGLTLAGVPQGGRADRMIEARIRIERVPAGAEVEAAYTLSIGTAPLTLDALLVPGGRVLLDEIEGRDLDFVLERPPGLYRVTVHSDAPRRASLRLRYRVTGGAARIPVFSPSAPIIPGESRLRILIEGVPERGGRDGFPRIERDSAGTLIAEPTNLPTVVLLPTDGGPFTVRNVTSATVLLLLTVGSLYWTVRMRARPGRA